MNDDELRSRRISYERDALDESTAAADPFAQFGAWLHEALHDPDVAEPHGMTLATANAAGAPSARIVLLRGWDRRGFVFYTSYDSRKAADLDAQPQAALLFWWSPLQRQLRIEGTVERVGAEESDAYFESRPRGHRLSAWASRQSAPVADRAVLDAAMARTEQRFPGDVPRPPFWGGYRLVPAAFEFWQGRPNRVHDRIAYRRAGEAWERVRLSP